MRLTRRRFLGTTSLAVAGALTRSEDARAWLTPLEGLTGREIVIPARGVSARLSIQPDYVRSLDRVLLSVPAGSLPGRTGASAPSLPFLREVYAALIAALPEYTEIDVVSAAGDRDRVEGLIGPLAGGRALRLHAVGGLSTTPDLWAQDLGEPFSIDGEFRFLVSMPVDESDDYNSRITQSREAIARAVLGRAAVTRADFVFEGGNLSVDRTSRGARVFVGYNDLVMTVRAYEARSRRLTLRKAAEKIAAWTDGAEVVVIGTDTQSPYLRHIDQSFTLLADEQAVVNVVDGAPTLEQRQLVQYRAQLETLGYRVIPLATTAAAVRAYHASTNVVPFVDRVSGQRTVILPVFPGEVRPGAGVALDEADLAGKGRAAADAFRRAGYASVPIRDFSHVAGGNAHCLTNVLA